MPGGWREHAICYRTSIRWWEGRPGGGWLASTTSASWIGAFVMRMTDPFKVMTRQQVIKLSRSKWSAAGIDELGTREPSIERSGEDRILVRPAGPAGPGPAQGDSRQDRQDDLPAGGRAGQSQFRRAAHRSEFLPMMPDASNPNAAGPEDCGALLGDGVGDRADGCGEMPSTSRVESRW